MAKASDRTCHQKGLTLTEVMVSLGIIVLILSVGLPRLSISAQAQRERGAVQLLVALIKNAESYSYSRETTLKLTKTGRVIQMLDLNNQRVDIDSDITLPEKIVTNIPDGDFITFKPSGQLSVANSLNPLTFDSQVVSIRIRLSPYGEVEVEE